MLIAWIERPAAPRLEYFLKSIISNYLHSTKFHHFPATIQLDVVAPVCAVGGEETLRTYITSR